MRAWRQLTFLFVVVGVAYALGAQLAFSWFGADGVSASFFPSAGLTVAALLLVERAQWPIVLAGAAAGEVLVDVAHDLPWGSTLGFTAANLVQPLVAVILVRLFVRTVDLGRTRDLVAYVGCCVVIAPGLGALIGALTYVTAADGEGYWRFVSEWWVGDGLGVLVVGGAVLSTWSSATTITRRVHTAEALLLMAASAVTVTVVFAFDLFGLAVIPAVLLIAIASRVGTRAVAVSSAYAAFAVAAATAEGHRVWESADVTPDTGLLYLQLALGTLVVTALALAAEINQREEVALAWARADGDRQEQRQLTQQAERLGRLAEALSAVESPAAVGRVLTAHGFGSLVPALLVNRATPEQLANAAQGAAEVDVLLATAVTRSAAHALDRVDALAHERRLHAELEAFAADETLLARLSDAMEEVTTASARASRVVDVLAAHRGLISAIELVDDVGARRVVAAREPHPARTSSAVVVSLRARGRLLGSLSMDGLIADGQTQPVDATLARKIATRVAMALDNAMLYERERDASRALQLGLLGGPLPAVDGLEFAPVYRPGTAALEVGGDWYDAFALPSGAIGIIVGDVVGHGLQSAIVMGHLRSAVRSLAPLSGPAALLERLDELVTDVPDAQATTLVYAELHPGTGTLRYAVAGHPPPLLLQPDGQAAFLWDARSAPIGVPSRHGRLETTTSLEPGSRLVMYTDGLVETRTAGIDKGLGRLLDTVRGLADRSCADLVASTVAAMVEGRSQDDDVCVMAVEVWPADVGFHHSIPAAPDQLSGLRRMLRAWLEGHRVEATAQDAVLLAVGESAANAIEHGYGFDPQGAVEVDVTVEDPATLCIVVRDRGRWLEHDPDPDRGRGTMIMNAVMDSVRVNAGPDGTEVEMRRRPTGPMVLAS